MTRTRHRFTTAAATALAFGAAATASAQGTAASLSQALAGNTVSAVMFLPHEDKVDRVMFQAFLRADGSELMRRWDAAQDAYTVPADARWTLSGDTLCLGLPGLGPEQPICIEIHIYGPRIAGNTGGTGRFAMLDGDIEPGNSIAGQR